MSAPYYADDSVTLHHGDALTVLSTLPDASVNCCVTSPPYFGLRDYGVAGQLGAESSPAEYVENLRALFAEVRRVLADDGTLWLNLGDSYYSGRGEPGAPDAKNSARRPGLRALDKGGATWAKPKNLLGIPWRVAFALQDDGWTLRNSIIWAKPNGMPESVTDRLSTKHEHVFMLAKSRRYWFDLDAVRDDQSPVSLARRGRADLRTKDGWAEAYGGNPPRGLAGNVPPGHRGPKNGGPEADKFAAGGNGGRNPGDVWSIPTQPFPGAHFAVYPLALPERCILAGCKPGGTVLDPFSGSGTTGLAAAKHGRRYVGIDLNADYLDLSLRTRLAQGALLTDEPGDGAA